MIHNARAWMVAFLACSGCIDLGSIKITIVDDTGWETGGTDDSGPGPDSTPVDTDDTGDSPIDDSGSPDDSGDTGYPVREEPTTYTGPPLGADVLIFQGAGALPVDSGPYLIDGIDELTAIYNAYGAEVVVTDTWPEDPSAYKLVFWYLPGAAEAEGYRVPEDTIDAVLDWMGRGGRLVVAGDVDGEYMGYSLTRGNQTIDVFLEEIGVDIRVAGTLNDPVSCEGTSGHPLMQHDATIDGYLGNSLEIAGDASWLYCDGIAVQPHWCGEVVVSGDVNLVSDNPAVATVFMQNLYEVAVETTCE